ncbi:MAG: nicotinate-nucleotide adenylyltransferase [Saprospiraceae bacterium]|nr:nicotinate-nucleotide adenylyltransferase [Saprospiraceae bacterium]
MEIGLFFGSFNPIHVGHLIIARAVLNHAAIEQVWFVVSPHSPFKERDSLEGEHHRLTMVDLATAEDPDLRSSAIEFELPRPSYTVDTLSHLREAYPESHFSLILGSDNLVSFERWKDHQDILKHHSIYVYIRPGMEDFALRNHPSIQVLTDVPMLHISSTYVRTLLHEDKSVRYLTVPSVVDYITNKRLYRLPLD